MPKEPERRAKPHLATEVETLEIADANRETQKLVLQMLFHDPSSLEYVVLWISAKMRKADRFSGLSAFSV